MSATKPSSSLNSGAKKDILLKSYNPLKAVGINLVTQVQQIKIGGHSIV